MLHLPSTEKNTERTQRGEKTLSFAERRSNLGFGVANKYVEAFRATTEII